MRRRRRETKRVQRAFGLVALTLASVAACSSSGSGTNPNPAGASGTAGAIGTAGALATGGSAVDGSAGSGLASAGGATGSAGSGGLGPVSVPTSHRIVAGNLVSCAIGPNGATCWGVAQGGAAASAKALSGSFHTLALGMLTGAQPVCGVATGGSVTCADWQGTASLAAQGISSCLPKGPLLDLSLDRYSPGGIAAVSTSGQIQVLAPSTCSVGSVPVGIATAVRVSAAATHVCALGADGSVACWDSGIGTLEPSLKDNFVDLAAGSEEACAVTKQGTVRCWDSSGKEDTGFMDFPQAVSGAGAPPVVQLASDARGHNLCALTNDGKVLCSQAFNLAFLRSFQLPAAERVTEIAVGDSHVCGIRADQSVLCVPLSCSPDCTTAITPPAGFKATSP